MIVKYRNQAIAGIAGGFATLFVAVGVVGMTERSPQQMPGRVIAIVLGIGGYLAYAFGCTAWAKAKGYSSALAIGLLVLGVVCFLLSSFLLPPVVLLVLEDKTRSHRKHSRRSK
jgi:uncharacterized membrane protein (GlpM family)